MLDSASSQLKSSSLPRLQLSTLFSATQRCRAIWRFPGAEGQISPGAEVIANQQAHAGLYETVTESARKTKQSPFVLRQL